MLQFTERSRALPIASRSALLVLAIVAAGCGLSLPTSSSQDQRECRFAGDLGCFALGAQGSRQVSSPALDRQAVIADDVRAIMAGMEQARSQAEVSDRGSLPAAGAAPATKLDDRLFDTP